MSHDPAPSSQDPAPAAPLLPQPVHEVLCGKLGKKYGALPMVPLPQDDEILISWVKTAAFHLRESPLLRRDRHMVIPDPEKHAMLSMSTEMFCSWALDYFVPYKMKAPRDGDPYPVLRDMPSDVAEKTLCSPHFVPHVPRVDQVNPVPMPKLSATGSLELMMPGYDAESRTYTFAP